MFLYLIKNILLMEDVASLLSSSTISIRKILVPIDGSSASLKALRYAARLAELDARDAELILLHVLEDIKQGGAIGAQAKYGNVRLVEGFKRTRRKAASQWLKQIEEAAKKKGIRLKTEIVDGDSKVDVILNYAEKNSIDLIVMGSRGLTGFKRLLLGSIANAVVTNAPCPVMVVR
jgi:nucleotide-binding universal stress UspA family protein